MDKSIMWVEDKSRSTI